MSAVTNNILNGASLSQVAAAIDKLNANGFGVATDAQLQSALTGLVNPGQYREVYTAYDAIAKAIADSSTSPTASAPSYTTIFKSGTSNGDILQSLVTFGNALSGVSDSGLSSSNALIKSAVITSGGGSLSSTMLQALYDTFNGTSSSTSSAYSELSSALNALKGALNPGTIDVSSTTTTSTTSPFTPGQNKTSQYPISATPSTTASNITSYTTQEAANQVAYNKAVYSALSNLLGQVITYSSGQNTLTSLLKGGGSVASQILDTGIQNAAANTLLGQSNTGNAAALQINQIRAIYTSSDLLSAYVDAAIKPNSAINPETQAQILTGLNQALSASAANQGLIAQTAYSIEQLLNSTATPTLFGQPVTGASLTNALGITTGDPFGSDLSNTQITQGLNAIDSLKNMVSGNSVANMQDAATASATLAKDYALVEANVGQLQLATGTTLNEALSKLVTTNSSTISTEIPGFTTLTSGSPTPQQTALADAIRALVGATASTGTTSLTANSPFTKLNTALGTSGTTAENIATLQGDAVKIAGANGTGGYVAAINAIMNSGNQLSSWSSSTSGSIGAQIAQVQGLLNTLDSQSTASQSESFAEGLATNPSTTIANLEQQVQSYISALKTYDGIGNAANATWSTSGVKLTSNTLSSMLQAAGASPGVDLGFATAAANSIQNALTSVQSLVGTSDFSASTLAALTGVGAASGSSSVLGNLNTAVSKLYSLDPAFFGANSQTNKTPGNLSNISNIYSNNAILQDNQILGAPSQGIGATSVGGGITQNPGAAGYFKNLVNLNTITSLLGSVVGGTASAPAASSSYTTAFGTNGSNGVVGTLLGSSNANYNNLTTGLATGTNATQLIQELMTLGSSLNTSTLSASAFDALKPYFATAGTNTSGAAFNAWTAWKAIAFAPSGSTSTLAQLGSLVNQAPTSAVAIYQLLQDAKSLNAANAALTTSGSGLAGSNVSSGLLNVNSTNAAAFTQAMNAANAVGQLLKALPDSSGAAAATNASSVISLIQALNTYDHNITLLNNLAPTSTGVQAGQTIASQILNYLQAETGAKGLTGVTSGAISTNATEIQGLLNRLKYLQGLQAQVQQAIDNNPYALVMGKDQAVKSSTFQAAAGALANQTTGLFNAATADTLFGTTTSSTGTTYNPTSDMSSAFSSLSTTLGYQMDNLTTYNGLIADLTNPSESILLNPTSGVLQSTAQSALQTIAQNVYDITTYLAPVSTSAAGGTSANTSNFNSISSAYNSINSALSNSAVATLGTLFSTGSNGAAGTGALTISSLSQTTENATSHAKSTVLAGMQAIVALNNMFGSIQSDAAGTAPSQGFKNFQASTGSNGLGSLNTNIAGLTNALNTSADNLSTIKTINSAQIGTVAQILQALENNSTTAGLINSSATIDSSAVTTAFTNDTSAAWEAVSKALTPVIGAANVALIAPSVSSGSTLASFLTAAQNLIGTAQNGGKGAALQMINDGIVNKYEVNTTNLQAAIPKLIEQAQTLNSLYTTVQDSVVAATSSSKNSILAAAVGGSTGGPGSAGASGPSTTGPGSTGTPAGSSTPGSAGSPGSAGGPGTPAGSPGSSPTPTTTTSNAVGITPAQYNAIKQVVQEAATIFGSSTSGSSTANSSPFEASGILSPTSSGVVSVADSEIQSLISSSASSSSTSASMPTALTGNGAPTSFAGLVAYELTLNGVTAGSNVGDTLKAASSTQLETAIQAALSSPALTNAMMQPLVEKALVNVLDAVASYNSANNTLSPLLNSAKATSATILNDALNNASSLQGLLSKLNLSGTVMSGTTASTTGLLKASTIAKIEAALNNMKNSSATYAAAQNAINANTPAAQQAQQIEAAVTASNNLQTSLNALTILGNTQFNSSTQSNYLSDVATVTNAQADYMAANYTLPSLLAALKSTSQNFASSPNAQAVQTSVAQVYREIMQTANLNPSAARAALSNLVNEISNLQDQVVGALAGLVQASQNAGSGTTQPAGGVAASVKEGAHAGTLLVSLGQKGSALFEMPAGSPQQQVNALKTLLNNLQTTSAYAKASLIKLQADLKGYYVATASASHAPMQTMNSNGNMYGIDVQFGYKQFFGKKKRWGLRYYANFSYQHGTFMVSDASDLDNFTYGAGVDALYNFYESKDSKYTTGLFAGLMLEGSSWGVKGQSYYTNLMNYYNAHGGHAVMNTSYFQIPLNLGFRTNVNKHNGFEIGLRIPLAVNYYFKGELDGSKLDIAYKRNVSVFFNYVYNF
ncbi:hypothetical protein NHP190003_12070 [Helicobacter sp. NHP19-003]|uniref:Uncharacterized protein n=1 Tax=Helicobacter gastrocanis TaxID=2849641 RepID=A0ABM7SBA7_9HELI|nr:outer membrane protein [Helicobacter sp. NHP19-003]BCZ17925.1 hypothetical protein NHP190003_12070 [Helicobacter sp. NHP19-003]